jgi:hypothetical protein
MSTISCPKCQDQVTVPASAPRSARVRCPLCQEEYDLADALAQLPPALIVISAAPEEELVLASVGAREENSLEGDSRQEFSAGLLDTGPAHEKLVSAPTPSFRSAPRPKRKEKSMVVELVKIVLGGVVGIGLAILILWWGPGVDLGIAPTVAKVSWMRWVLPQKILDKVEKNQPVEENPPEAVPLNPDKQAAKPKETGKLGNDPRFEEALKSSGTPKASGNFAKTETPKAKSPDKDPFDTSDPLAPETKSSEVGELKIESPLFGEPESTPKKPQPAKTSPAKTPTEEPSGDDPFKSPTAEKPTPVKKPAEPAAETPPEEPAEKPEEKPAEPKPAAEEAPAVPASLAAGIDAANSAAKAFDATDAADKEARKSAVTALYNAYADLGRAVEQTNLEDADNAEQLSALRQTLAQAANEPVKLNSIGSLAARKLDAEGGDLGILLAGTVKEFRAAGRQFETTLELVKDKRLVTVVSSKNPQDTYQVDDQVLILGSIIRDPKEKLAGYQGEASLVVKSGHAMVLPAEKEGE